MLSRLTLGVSLASIFLGGESIRWNSLWQFPFVQQENVHSKVLKDGDGVIRSMGSAQPHRGKQIQQYDRDTWNMECSSVLTNHECGRAVDGVDTTFWQTQVSTESIDPLPHHITIDLREILYVNAISMRPLPDADLGGAIAAHKVYLSEDNETWNLAAFGTWFEDVQGELSSQLYFQNMMPGSGLTVFVQKNLQYSNRNQLNSCVLRPFPQPTKHNSSG